MIYLTVSWLLFSFIIIITHNLSCFRSDDFEITFGAKLSGSAVRNFSIRNFVYVLIKSQRFRLICQKQSAKTVIPVTQVLTM